MNWEWEDRQERNETWLAMAASVLPGLLLVFFCVIVVWPKLHMLWFTQILASGMLGVTVGKVSSRLSRPLMRRIWREALRRTMVRKHGPQIIPLLDKIDREEDEATKK